MLHLRKARGGTLCDRISRRELLQIGGCGVLGLSLADLFRQQSLALASRAMASPAQGEEGHPSARAKSCIILFLAGGPSQLDMWDMKPDAPAEIRGEFKPIATTVPGIQFSDQLPRSAQMAHHVAVIRSAQHRVSNAHAAATYTALTGDDRGDTTIAIGEGPKDYPAIGAVLSMLHPPARPVVPFVSLPYITAEGRGGPPQPGVYGGWLGRAWDPLFVLRDPNAPDFRVPELTLLDGLTPQRLNSRRGLLQLVSGRLAGLDQSLSSRGMDGFYGRAFSILTSPETRQAFDIGQEPESVRDAYGRNIYGQSVLLSRRLIEAGTRMVTLKWAPDANATWDTHGNNFNMLRGELLPHFDAALASLLKDLDERGLLKETLVVAMGEFGRTPTVNKAAGRDHWPFCYSLLLAGGGVAGGRVFGRSDKIGAFPAESPVTPQDILGTIYTLLGIRPDVELADQFGRRLRLVSEGRVINEVLA